MHEPIPKDPRRRPGEYTVSPVHCRSDAIKIYRINANGLWQHTPDTVSDTETMELAYYGNKGNYW